MSDVLIPVGELYGTNATRELHQTIREFNERAEQQTQEMVKLSRRICGLTWALVALTVAMLAGVIVQIVLTTTG